LQNYSGLFFLAFKVMDPSSCYFVEANELMAGATADTTVGVRGRRPYIFLAYILIPTCCSSGKISSCLRYMDDNQDPVCYYCETVEEYWAAAVAVPSKHRCQVHCVANRKRRKVQAGERLRHNCNLNFIGHPILTQKTQTWIGRISYSKTKSFFSSYYYIPSLLFRCIIAGVRLRVFR
jgi:hypothetical protein